MTLEPCPICGAKAYCQEMRLDDMYSFGWSAGCPRFQNADGIHGDYRPVIHGAATKAKAIESWNKLACKIKENVL